MRIILIPAFLALLLLTACSGGPGAVDRYVGTDGLTVEFAENAPPEVVYEETAFPARVLVRNAGAQDVRYDRFLITFSTDPLYIGGGISPYLPSERDPSPTPKTVRGKSSGFPAGELVSFSMPLDSAFTANRVVGQRERPETTITAGICYAYATHYSASVCVDTNAYQENLRAQPCQAEEVTSAGGQGAPVAVTSVKVQGFPVIDRDLGIEATRPYFTIMIEDVGLGQLVGPDTLELERACLLQGIPKEQLGAVRIQAFLVNTPLECQPDGFVRLVAGKGEVRCTVSQNDLADPLYASSQNYRSTLTLNLSYVYKSATEATVAIERVPGERAGEVLPVGGRVTGYEYIRESATVPQATLPGTGEVQLTTTGPVVTDATGTEWRLLATPDGNAVSSCELYANNPDLIPEGRGQLRDILTPAWSCACGQARCVTLSRSGQCLAGLCPGSTYCCTDEKPTAPEGEAVTAPLPAGGGPVVEVARAEYEFFAGQSECDTDVRDRVNAYFEAGNCPTNSCSGTPWSAAFISYVMAQASESFPAACAHSTYFTKIRNSQGQYGCEAKPISQIDSIQVGDVLCNCRGSGCPATFEGVSGDGHCDVVAGRDSDTLTLIGGNVGDTVSARSLTISTVRSNAAYYGFLSC